MACCPVTSDVGVLEPDIFWILVSLMLLALGSMEHCLQSEESRKGSILFFGSSNVTHTGKRIFFAEVGGMPLYIVSNGLGSLRDSRTYNADVG